MKKRESIIVETLVVLGKCFVKKHVDGHTRQVFCEKTCRRFYSDASFEKKRRERKGRKQKHVKSKLTVRVVF